MWTFNYTKRVNTAMCTSGFSKPCSDESSKNDSVSFVLFAGWTDLHEVRSDELHGTPQRRNFLLVMVTGGSLPQSQEHATCPYTEPDQSSPLPPTPLLGRSILILSHLRLGLPSGLSPSGFRIKTLYAALSPIRATCPAYLSSRCDHPNDIW